MNRRGPGNPSAQAAPIPDLRHAGNLRHVIGWRQPMLTLAGCLASGLLLSLAFPPFEWGWIGWLALVPALSVGVPTGAWGRVAAGYLLGLSHCLVSLSWLNHVGFAAGVLMAVCCAVFIMIWYLGMAALAAALGMPGSVYPRRLVHVPPGWRHAALVLGGSLIWVGLEWVRGWIFTGFPWNALGISQWRHVHLLALTAVTGVAGISFLMVAANLAVALTVHGWGRHRGRGQGRGWMPSCSILTLGAISLVAAMAAREVPRSLPSSRSIRILAVQGNIPQCRFWSEEQFDEALRTYIDLTVLGARLEPDLVVWPESAVPASLSYPPFQQALSEMMSKVRIPLLLGALDTRPLPGARWTDRGWDPPALEFNAAVLLDARGRVQDVYDKVHRVPFGEYVPFGRHLPWLVELIGMGRDLTPGREFTVLEILPGVHAGVNICFEDVFPEISRAFVRRGAGLLMTLTNDAWYAESSGSRQHMLHAVFRAAENRRPLFRSGNNSDTCLILPDGTVHDLLYDTVSGNRFVRGTRLYTVPIPDDPPLTFYARAGDWLGAGCGCGAGILAACLAVQALRRRLYLRRLITGVKDAV